MSDQRDVEFRYREAVRTNYAMGDFDSDMADAETEVASNAFDTTEATLVNEPPRPYPSSGDTRGSIRHNHLMRPGRHVAGLTPSATPTAYIAIKPESFVVQNVMVVGPSRENSLHSATFTVQSRGTLSGASLAGLVKECINVPSLQESIDSVTREKIGYDAFHRTNRMENPFRTNKGLPTFRDSAMMNPWVGSETHLTDNRRDAWVAQNSREIQSAYARLRHPAITLVSPDELASLEMDSPIETYTYVMENAGDHWSGTLQSRTGRLVSA